ncbi:hypothetical protein BKA69DRAFT_1105351 [Paraphysoderma sedebokerense]|nr:hypothetical protein BKA69DRAFT_1105351 [Paraphysoderma sedebokerense]
MNLASSEAGVSPIVCYYHLLDEARTRHFLLESKRRFEQIARSSSATLVFSKSSSMMSIDEESQLQQSQLHQPQPSYHHQNTAVPQYRPHSPVSPIKYSQSPVTQIAYSIQSKHQPRNEYHHANPNLPPPDYFRQESKQSAPTRRFSFRQPSAAAPTTTTTLYTPPSPSSPIKQPSTSKEIRTVRGFFSLSASTSKPLQEIRWEIERALMHSQIAYERVSDYLYSCEEILNGVKGNKFEVEICRVERMNTYCIQTKRLRGTVWSHKKLCNRLIEEMSL